MSAELLIEDCGPNIMVVENAMRSTALGWLWWGRYNVCISYLSPCLVVIEARWGKLLSDVPVTDSTVCIEATHAC